MFFYFFAWVWTINPKEIFLATKKDNRWNVASSSDGRDGSLSDRYFDWTDQYSSSNVSQIRSMPSSLYSLVNISKPSFFECARVTHHYYTTKHSLFLIDKWGASEDITASNVRKGHPYLWCFFGDWPSPWNQSKNHNQLLMYQSVTAKLNPSIAS